MTMQSQEVPVDVHYDEDGTSQIRSPEDFQDPVFTEGKCLTPSVLNSTLKIALAEADAILTSPVIVKKINNPSGNSNEVKTVSESLHRKILNDLSVIVNNRLTQFFENELEEKIESIIDAKYIRTNDSSVKNTSLAGHSILEKTINQPSPNPHEIQKDMFEMLSALNNDYNNFKSQHAKFIENVESIDSLTKDLTALASEMANIQAQITTLQADTDENLAKVMLEKANCNERLSAVESKASKNSTDIASDRQYTRRETIEFHNIPIESTYYHPECTYEIIINFLKIHFDIHLTMRDISVCHRQVIPTEKKKAGRKYIPPIYCKFLNRSIALHILKDRKHCLKNARNAYGQPLEVKHNLTPENRLIWEDVQNNLPGYKIRYISNWKIFVKKDSMSKPIHVASEKVLHNLIDVQSNEAQITITSSTAPCEDRVCEDLPLTARPTHTHKSEPTLPSQSSSKKNSRYNKINNTGSINNEIDWFSNNWQSYAQATAVLRPTYNVRPSFLQYPAPQYPAPRMMPSEYHSRSQPCFRFNNKTLVNYRSTAH